MLSINKKPLSMQSSTNFQSTKHPESLYRVQHTKLQTKKEVFVQ